MEFNIHFGAMSPTIKQQFINQKLSFDNERAEYFEKIKTSINFLRIGSFINDASVKKAELKLFKYITEHLNKKNKNVPLTDEQKSDLEWSNTNQLSNNL